VVVAPSAVFGPPTSWVARSNLFLREWARPFSPFCFLIDEVDCFEVVGLRTGKRLEVLEGYGPPHFVRRTRGSFFATMGAGAHCCSFLRATSRRMERLTNGAFGDIFGYWVGQDLDRFCDCITLFRANPLRGVARRNLFFCENGHQRPFSPFSF
jgi:hypothetical protein